MINETVMDTSLVGEDPAMAIAAGIAARDDAHGALAAGEEWLANQPPAEDMTEWPASEATMSSTQITSSDASAASLDEQAGGRLVDVAADASDATAPDGAVDASPHTDLNGADGAADGQHGMVSGVALVEALVETVTPRRSKRRASRDILAHVDDATHVVAASDVEQERTENAAQEPSLEIDPAPAVGDDDPLWREQWPLNEVRMIGRLLPRFSDAPALDGVQRTRMELALVEQHDGVFGSMGNVPIFVMPGAPGFTPILTEMRRARRHKERLAPITVEVHGILRQLPDRDGRYATERYRVLMGIEVHRITRVAADTEQFAYWRGRARITASRRYEYKGIAYQRVTAVVELRQRKPRLRGTSITHVPVDFLVAPEHEHADRFGHLGQRLLIEANITPETQRMNDHHPDLDGIDDPRRRAQLQVLRESIVSVTLGEFPDEHAEREYQAWVKDGRRRPERGGRAPRRTALAQPSGAAITTGAGDDRRAQEHGRRPGPGAHAADRGRPGSV